MFDGKRYTLEMLGAFVLYVGVLIPSRSYLRTNPDADLATVISLAPVAPVLLAAWVIVRHLLRMDELQKRIQFEALAITFTITALGTIAYGFLQNVGFPAFNTMFIGTGSVGVWGICTAFTSRRYR